MVFAFTTSLFNIVGWIPQAAGYHANERKEQEKKKQSGSES